MSAKPMPVDDPLNHTRQIAVDIARRKRKSGPAEVIPFPSARRQQFITNAHVIAADLSDAEVADYFRTILSRHKQRLEQLSVEPRRVADDVAALRNYFFG